MFTILKNEINDFRRKSEPQGECCCSALRSFSASSRTFFFSFNAFYGSLYDEQALCMSIITMDLPHVSTRKVLEVSF